MNLTARQRAAVEAEESDVLVVSGAGSGKTSVLAARVQWLLDNGADPSELLVLTFTRKAAGELQARIGDAAHGMPCGTFHGVALEILREDGAHLGYNPDTITVVDPADAELLLVECCRELGFWNGENVWQHGLSLKKVKKHLERVYSGQDVGLFTGFTLEIIAMYWRRLRNLNCLDFGMILRETNRLLGAYPDVLAKWRARIKHVLVDEGQDLDAVQYRLNDWFSPPATSFIVGDLRQTIYGFRGACPELMTGRHPDARVISLTDCFRCGPRIAEAANRLIGYNRELGAVDMLSMPPGKRDAVETFHGRSAAIVEAVQQAHDRQMFAWGDIAVLARTHRELERLGKLMGDAEIPYHRVGSGFDICDTDEFRLLHAALRLCVNPRDDLAFLRLRDAFGLTAEDYATVCKRAAADGTGHYAAYDAIATGWFNRSERDANTLWNTITQALADEAPTTGCVGSLSIDIFSSTRPLDAEQFWLEHCRDMPVDEALRWFATRDSQDDCKDGNHVTLTTVHGAKGLEWPCVFVVNMNEGGFPSGRSIKEPEGVRDERRVCYVAATRARERLVLHYRVAADQSPKRPFSEPSRFLAEAGLLETPWGGPSVGAKPAPSPERIGGAGALEMGDAK